MFRGLLGVHSRYGLPARGAAKRPFAIEGFDGFVTSTAAPIATGWSDPVAGRDLHPLKTTPFHDVLFTNHYESLSNCQLITILNDMADAGFDPAFDAVLDDLKPSSASAASPSATSRGQP